jgi:hypothetical protein
MSPGPTGPGNVGAFTPDEHVLCTLVVYPTFVKEEIFPAWEPEGEDFLLVAELEAWAASEDDAETVAVLHFCLILNNMEIQHPLFETFDRPFGFG